MKKYFLLLLFTAISFAQTTGVTKLKISANPEKTAATRVMVQDATTGEVGYVDKTTISQSIKTTKIVRNQTGSTLTKGTVVYQSGVSGGKLLVAKALASVKFMSETTLGIVENDIPNNTDGNVVTSGTFTGFNTASFFENSILYLSDATAGTVTATKPSSPSYGISLGVVTAVGTAGSIDIRIGSTVVSKSDVGLSNVDNTSDLNKPISTATQSALNLKAPIASPTFTGNITASGFKVASGGTNYLLANGTTTPYSSGVFNSQLSIVGSSYLPIYSEGATTISTQTNTLSFGSSVTKQINLYYGDIQDYKTLVVPNIGETVGELVLSKYTHNSTYAVPRFTSSKMLERGHIWDASVGVGISSSETGVFIPSYLFQLQLDSAAKPSTNTWTIASDSRLKENIQNYTKGLSAILSIRPVTYDYNGKAGFSKIKGNIGVIAQEVQNIVPEGVSTFSAKLNTTDTSDTVLYNFNSHAITYILINAIKELNQKISALETEVELLKAK
ncbi:MAG: hypothetical protein RIQ59_551 [Bacteroidota bacterium]|jgi:hypothetical protein